ncbi:MAG: integrin alpha [Cyanobacteria bacterium P01_A01_bin.83]
MLQNYSDCDRVTSQYHSLDGVNKLFANTGDVNQDGISDIIIGRPGSSALADSYIVFGSRQYGVDNNVDSNISEIISIQSPHIKEVASNYSFTIILVILSFISLLKAIFFRKNDDSVKWK